jgi:hypothetical protein
MGWNLGRYYTRSSKVNGRTIREYIGAGEAGRLAAQYDQERRQEVRKRHEAARQLMAELRAVDQTISSLCHRTEIAARAAMFTAGFYQHHREWRKRRGQ